MSGPPDDAVTRILIPHLAHAPHVPGAARLGGTAEPAARASPDPTATTQGAAQCLQCSDLIAEARARRFWAPPAADRRERPATGSAHSGADRLTFEQVLAAAQENASWALTRLYESLAPAVVGYMRSQGIREAEDLTSDVFVVVLSRSRSFSGTEAQFRKWVFTIAHHRIVDERRKCGRAPQVEPIDGAELAGRQSCAGAEDEALGRLALDRVRLLLAGLTADQRDVLVLRVIAGLSVDEVASVLDKRPEAVKALQRRALGALRRQRMKATGWADEAG